MSRRTVGVLLAALVVVSMPSVSRADTTSHARATATVVGAAPETAVRALARPGAPRAVSARAGDGSVKLRWRPPSTSGDRPISGYRIQRRIGSTWRTITTVAASVRRFTITGLDIGTTQSVRVAAVSRAGVGPMVTRSVVLPSALGIAIDSATGNGDPNLACALMATRRVKCWGSNSHGAFGIGFAEPAQLAIPLEVVGLRDVAEIGVGGEFACARKLDGTVWCWGSDQYNQLSGRSGDSYVPYQVPGIAAARELSVGPMHACVRVQDATLRCFGNNGNGQVGSGNILPTDVVTPAITGVAQVSAGAFHTCAVRTNGTMACWGLNSPSHAFGLPDNGSYATPTDIPGITTARQVASGSFFTCVRLADGNAMCAGSNTQGQIGDSTTTNALTFTDVFDVGTMTNIKAGRSTVCATYDDGSIRCWGDTYGGGLGIGDDPTDYKSVPTPVVGLGAVRSFDVGSNNICAITLTWRPRCVGLNDTGQLGIGSIGGHSAAWVEPVGF